MGGEDEGPEGVKAETLWELIDELSGRGFLVDKLIRMINKELNVSIRIFFQPTVRSSVRDARAARYFSSA